MSIPGVLSGEVRWQPWEGWMATIPVCRQFPGMSHTQTVESLNDSVVRPAFVVFSVKIKIKFCTQFCASLAAASFPVVVLEFLLGYSPLLNILLHSWR